MDFPPGWEFVKPLALANELNILRILDINLRAPFYDDALICESIDLCTVLKLSDEELEKICQACELNSAQDEEKMSRGNTNQIRIESCGHDQR